MPLIFLQANYVFSICTPQVNWIFYKNTSTYFLLHSSIKLELSYSVPFNVCVCTLNMVLLTAGFKYWKILPTQKHATPPRYLADSFSPRGISML